MKHLDKIKEWDNIHCEKHVLNLVNNIKHLLKEKKINEVYYIDIGANVGKVYDLLKKYCTIKKVWMFEASPTLFNYLELKYKEDKNVTLKNIAVSDKLGEVNFDESTIFYQINNNIPDLNFGLSKIVNSSTDLKIQSDKITNLLDSDEIFNNVSFIKIDTENMDFFILKDLISIVDKFKIKPIIEFEVNYHMSTITKEMAQEILFEYKKYGYKELRLEDCWGEGILIPK